MPLAYTVYGLRLLADARIPGLLPSSGAEHVDVYVWLNRMPPWWQPASKATGSVWYRSPGTNESGQAGLTVWKLERDGWFRVSYCDGTDFLVDPLGGEIWSSWPPSATLEDSATYLVGPVLGFVLRLRGLCCLHASAVNVGQRVIAIVGPAQAGKSSTAAAFAKQGYPIVSDDIVVLAERDGGLFVQPGYPRLCLWPDIVTSLYGSPQQLPRITPADGTSDWWDKRYLDLTSENYHFQILPLPLSAVYLLADRSETSMSAQIEAVSPSAALMELVGNTYMNYLLDRTMRSKEFQSLSRIVSTIPVRRAIPLADQASLPGLCEAILEDHASLLRHREKTQLPSEVQRLRSAAPNEEGTRRTEPHGASPFCASSPKTSIPN